MSELDHLLANIEQAEQQTEQRKQWQPKHIGEIDIRIAADGQWFHEGRPFQRMSLVKLFASVLRKEDNDYFLTTPAEKLKIQVDDAPFVATMVETQENALVFTTNLEDKFIADAEHPIRVEIDIETQTPRPYVHYRDGLDALISRSAFFDLINLAEEHERDGKTYLTVSSMGQTFDLGCAEETT
jgi:hypothetical protein